MIESIAMWGGIAGLVASVFAIIILYLTRKNILDILDKDVILFNKNFDLKKEAITKALELADEVAQRGKSITSSYDFQQKAKQCYNDLLCVTSEVKVADEFYSIAVDTNTDVTQTKVAQFKLMCRRDIGLKTKKSKLLKRTSNQQSNSNDFDSMPRGSTMSEGSSSFSSGSFSGMTKPTPASTQSFAEAPQRPQFSQPSQPATPARPIRPATRPTTPPQKPAGAPKSDK